MISSSSLLSSTFNGRVTSGSSSTTTTTIISGGGLRLLLDCGLLRALKRCLQPLKTNGQVLLPEERVHRPILYLLSSMELMPSDLKTTGAGLPRVLQEYGRRRHTKDVHHDVSTLAIQTRSHWASMLWQEKKRLKRGWWRRRKRRSDIEWCWYMHIQI